MCGFEDVQISCTDKPFVYLHLACFPLHNDNCCSAIWLCGDAAMLEGQCFAMPQ
jgi:hypothetical protein